MEPNTTRRTYIARVRLYGAYFNEEDEERNLEKIRDTDLAWEIGEDGSGMTGVQAELLDWEIETREER